MAGNEHETKARERKALDLVAAADHFVTKVARTPDERITVLSALIESLWGGYGPERQSNDWEALLCVANRASAVRHHPPSDETKAMVLGLLDHQLHTEQANCTCLRSDAFAGLSVVKS